MMLDRISDAYRKVLWFAACGALGCAVAALLGEAWLAVTRTSPQPQPVAICLLLDCSGSMAGDKLDEMKRAASDFVQRQDLSRNRLAVVGFDSFARSACPLSQERTALLSAISGLQVNGSTNMAEGLRAAMSALSTASGDKYILLFTDGMPDMPPDTLRESGNCRSQGTQIVTVATGDANTSYLAQVTNDLALVFPANAGQFEHAFQNAEKAIFGRQLVESAPTGAGLGFNVLRIGVWTLLLAAGVGLALVAGQNLYLRRPIMTKSEALRAGLGSAVAGFVAGGIGQLLFSGTTDASIALVVLGRIVGWTLVGLLLGLGIARFVPNLKPLRGLAGGAVGGVVGGIGFLLIGLVLGDVAGRLMGAALIGFWIGAMIAFVEAAFREAWLEVQYGPSEMRTVSLGRRPVTVGGDASQATVFIAGALPIALRYIFEGGKVYCEDAAGGQRSVISPGDSRMVGKATVRLRTAAPRRTAEANFAAHDPTTRQRAASLATSSDSPGGVSTTPSANGPLGLRIRGRQFVMTLGAKLRAAEIPGLETSAADQVVAEVVSNPQDPTILGLKNLSSRVWEAITPDGKNNRIEPGRTARLALGTKLRFGLTEGVIEPATTTA